MPAPHIAALRTLMPKQVPVRLRPGGGPSAPLEACHLCAAPLDRRHEHLLERATRRLSCACIACALLFEGRAASAAETGDGKRRESPTKMLRLPRDTRYIPNLRLSGEEWASLGVPVQLAFFTFDSSLRRWMAYYPSPGGAIGSPVEDDTWRALTQSHPALERLAPDVEALLAVRTATPQLCFFAPLDQCYRLTGLIRQAHHAQGGSSHLAPTIAAFCAELLAEARIEAGIEATSQTSSQIEREATHA